MPKIARRRGGRSPGGSPNAMRMGPGREQDFALHATRKAAKRRGTPRSALGVGSEMEAAVRRAEGVQEALGATRTRRHRGIPERHHRPARSSRPPTCSYWGGWPSVSACSSSRKRSALLRDREWFDLYAVRRRSSALARRLSPTRSFLDRRGLDYTSPPFSPLRVDFSPLDFSSSAIFSSITFLQDQLDRFFFQERVGSDQLPMPA